MSSVQFLHLQHSNIFSNFNTHLPPRSVSLLQEQIVRLGSSLKPLSFSIKGQSVQHSVFILSPKILSPTHTHVWHTHTHNTHTRARARARMHIHMNTQEFYHQHTHTHTRVRASHTHTHTHTNTRVAHAHLRIHMHTHTNTCMYTEGWHYIYQSVHKSNRKLEQLFYVHVLGLRLCDLVQSHTRDSLLVRLSAPDPRSKGCEFESRQERREDFLLQGYLCVLTLVRCPFHPRVTAVARKRPWSFCQKCRWQVSLHLNTHTPLTQQSRSELTIPLSRHSVGTYPESSTHATCQGTFGHSRLSSLSHCGLILA